MRRFARILRRAWDCEAGAYGQTGAHTKNALLDDIAEKLFGFGWKLRP